MAEWAQEFAELRLADFYKKVYLPTSVDKRDTVVLEGCVFIVKAGQEAGCRLYPAPSHLAPLYSPVL